MDGGLPHQYGGLPPDGAYGSLHDEFLQDMEDTVSWPAAVCFVDEGVSCAKLGCTNAGIRCCVQEALSLLFRAHF